MVGQPRTTGIITDIQRRMIHNGPGVRTAVYFKGCPLHCEWCFNPECISFPPQELFYKEKCIECGKCKEGCKRGARVNCGRCMTVEAVLREIREGIPYYGSQGGVTFTGGEPQAQAKFLAECVEQCKKAGIRTAIETSLIYYLPELLKDMQVVIADLKIWDEEEHRRWTGVSNRKIKENFQKLDTLNVPIIVRTPVIPQVNATIENISAIADFAAEMKNVIQYELLPYQPIGEAKREALAEAMHPFEVPDEAMMKELNHFAFKR